MRIFIVQRGQCAEEFDDTRIGRDLGKFFKIGFRNNVVVGVDAGHLPSLILLPR